MSLGLNATIPILFFSVLICIGIVATIIYIQINATAKHILRSTPIFLVLICIGGLISFAGVFASSTSNTWLTCSISNWTQHIGFVMSFGSMILKSYRINIIFNSKPSQISVITNFGLIARLAAALILVIIYLIVWTVANLPIPVSVYSYSNYNLTVSISQVCPTSLFSQYLLIIELLFLIYGAYIAYRTRKVPSDYNESQYLGIAVS